MKVVSAFVFFCLITSIGYSQAPAPNFIVTDSDGVVHDLYGDHLNQGQAVLIKLFFTSCPPCINFAAPLETLYQEWGGGNGDVEFIELSIMGWDNNSNVAAFKINHGISFPGVGADGGSVSATDIYRDGTYGPYFGTPTFVVIAPDGTVNYGINGIGIPATIEKIDEALEDAVGEPMGEVSVDVSISMAGFNGLQIDSTEVRVRSISNPGEDYHLGMTDVQGNFSFTYDSTFQYPLVDPAVYLVKNDSVTEGVTTFDLLLIQKYILNLNSLPDMLKFAGDINNNNSITGSDLVQLRKVILHLYGDFPDSNSYRFYSGGCVFPNPNEGSCEEIVPIDLTAPTQQINYVGIKVGGIN